MKVTICSSVDFSPKILEIAADLEARGCTVNIPFFTNQMRHGELTFEQYLAAREGDGGDTILRQANDVDLICRYWDFIVGSDAVLVLNMTKKGIDGYIGGNTLMEMGFAYGHRKKLFLYNPLPQRSERMHYLDELLCLKPIVINGNLDMLFADAIQAKAVS